MTDESNDSPGADVPASAENTAAVLSPGDMIRSARERARISVEDLATQIKLARSTLEALERDDFNQLLEPVYVRGYYRKCAKVLSLNEKELIDAYNSRAMPKAPSTPSKLRLASGTELGTGNRLPVSMAIFFAVVAAVIGTFVWSLVKTPPQIAIPVPAQVAPAPATLVEPVTPIVEGAAVPSSDAAPSDAAAAAAPTTAPATAAPAGAAAPSSTAAPAAASANPTPPVLDAAAIAALPDGTATLTFSNTSWARVDDAAGKVLLNGLEHDGDKRVLHGKLPFNVFLGNAPVVAVEFQGTAVDLTSRTTDNFTARFTLPMAAKR